MGFPNETETHFENSKRKKTKIIKGIKDYPLTVGLIYD
jgi:hypothetical protein